MTLLTDILTQYPHCRVTISGSRTNRRKPREGDRRFTKSRGWFIRRQRRHYWPDGRYSDCTRNGRPLSDWIAEDSLPADELDLLRRVGTSHGGLNPYTP